MQKFTRPLTREIDVASERLALTLTDQGINVRLVGSRKAPWEFSWATVLYQVVSQGLAAGLQPTPEQMTAVLELLRKGGPVEPAAPSTQTPQPAPMPSQPAEERLSINNETSPEIRPPQDAGVIS